MPEKQRPNIGTSKQDSKPQRTPRLVPVRNMTERKREIREATVKALA